MESFRPKIFIFIGFRQAKLAVKDGTGYVETDYDLPGSPNLWISIMAEVLKGKFELTNGQDITIIRYRCRYRYRYRCRFGSVRLGVYSLQ